MTALPTLFYIGTNFIRARIKAKLSNILGKNNEAEIGKKYEQIKNVLKHASSKTKNLHFFRKVNS